MYLNIYIYIYIIYLSLSIYSSIYLSIYLSIYSHIFPKPDYLGHVRTISQILTHHLARVRSNRVAIYHLPRKMFGKMWYSEPNDKLSPKEGYKIAVGLELG